MRWAGWWRADSRVLLIGAERARLFLSQGGRLHHAYEFTANEEGLRNFGHYLASASPAPVLGLVDLMDEEYRLENVPPVRGRERRAMLARRHARYFRNTPFWQALPQGRAHEGRRDARMLMMALTRPELVEPWLAQIAKHHAPLAGLYSLPALAPPLLARLGIGGSAVMLVSVEATGGLRQTFLRDGRLMLSRLVVMPRPGTVPHAAFVTGELVKLRRYLSSLALLGPEDTLHIHLLSHGEPLRELEAHCRNSESERYVLIDTATVAATLGLASGAASPESDVLFAQQLLDASPRQDYARAEDRADYRAYRRRERLLACSLGLLLTGAGIAAGRGLQTERLQTDTVRLQAAARDYLERAEAARVTLPATTASATEIRAAVSTFDWLATRRGDPKPFWSQIGQVLAQHPEVRLEALGWQADDSFAAPREIPGPQVSLRASFEAVDGQWAPRRVLASLDALQKALRALPGVVAVDIARAPFDLDPAHTLQGSTAILAPDTAPSVELLVRWQRRNSDGA